MTEAKPKDYWISPTALKITLNALSDADYIQASAASGAMIMCYMHGVEGLEYDHGHNYKRWPLKISQTYFTSSTRKYVYIRIPRPVGDVADVATDVAQVVFPSEHIDLYGLNEAGQQVDPDASRYYYIWTQGIISASQPSAEGLRREWEQAIVTGTLSSDEAWEGGGTGEWWRFDPITDMVTFLKKIAYATFEYLKADQAEVDELTAGNATVQKLLRAYNAYINKVQSTNYTGNGLLDTGWRITNDYEGSNSSATFDYLTVRKKAFFNELEIRKLSSIGGNFCMSPASGKIYRVEWYGADGESLGYDYYNIPWSVGGRLLGLFSKSLAQRFLGRRKRLSRRLTPEEKAAMRTIRCYFYTDDGTTQSMLNWTVGAQARCQTFNIEEQMDRYSGGESDNPDVGFYDSDHRGEEYRTETDMYGGTEFYRGHKVQNTYWWRLVTAVGKGKLEDGKVHYYIEFSVNTGSDRTHEDAGSDLPSVGDQVVQMGHRTRTDQQNVIMFETASEDAPAIKMYDGINSWDLTGRLVARMSPRGWRVVSNKFEWLTAYGEKGVTINRGLWVDIVQQPSRIDFTIDHAPLVQSRRCYYNDLVSHNGSYWRCIVASGTHKEDDNGYWYTQAEIDQMPIEEQMQLHDVQNYTTVEPGDAAFEQRAVWQMEVSIGISPYLVISPAMIAVPCEKDGKATAAYSVSASVKLMVTNVEASITSISMTGADAHVSLSGNYVSVNIPAGAAVTNKDYTITVEGTCNGQKYTATDKVSVYAVVKGNDAYEVTALPMNWLWNQEGANYSYADIKRMIEQGTSPSDFPILIDKVETLPDGTLGNSCTQLSVVNGGVAQQFQITSVVTSDRRVTASFNNVTGRVWVTQCPNTLESGWVDVTVSYGSNVSHTLRIPFWCNLLGTWREIIFADTRMSIAEKTQYLDNQYTQFHAEYVQSSQVVSNKLTKIDGIIGPNGEKMDEKLNTSEFKQTADSFSLCTTTYASNQASDAERNAKNAAQGYANSAENNAKNHADGVVDDIKTNLSEAGITITANPPQIKLIAGKTIFCNSSGDDAGFVEITNDGKIKAKDGEFSGKIEANQGWIGNFQIESNNLVSYNCGMMLTGTPPSNFDNNLLLVRGRADMWALTLGEGYLTSDPYNCSSFCVAFKNVTLPKWPTKGFVYFVKDMKGCRASVENPSNMRIIHGNGDNSTYTDMEGRSYIYVKLGGVIIDGTTYDCWGEWYCG